MTAEEQVKNWNREFKPGTRVRWEGMPTRTRSEAWVSTKGSGPVVQVEGIGSGAVPLDNLEPIAEGEE